MLDIKFIRDNLEKAQEGCRRKKAEVDLERLLELDGERRELMGKIEALKAERNKCATSEVEHLKEIKKEIKELEPRLDAVKKEFDKLMRQVPNLPFDDVIEGASDKDNKVLREEGEKRKFDLSG